MMPSFVRFCSARPVRQVRVHDYRLPHRLLVQSAQRALNHWLSISTAFLTVSSSKSGSEWVNMVGRIGPAALCVCLVYECPCLSLCASRPSLWRPLRRGRSFATAVMNLVSIHRVPFQLSWQTGGLAWYHVLFFLPHQPVLHRAFSWGCDVTGQPSLVPLVKALVLTGCHSVLGLWGEGWSCQLLIYTDFNKQQLGFFFVFFYKKRCRFSSRDEIKPDTNLSGFDQGSSAVHVIFRIHDKNHLVGVEFKSTIQTPSILYTQLAVPLSSAAHGLHLPHLPAPEAA